LNGPVLDILHQND